jgi:outer membrane protein, heavy metal efflux system
MHDGPVTRTRRSIRGCASGVLLLALSSAVVGAQDTGPSVQRVSLQQAIDLTVTNGARAALARADMASARATASIARERSNPVASFNWTQDAPRLHGFLQFPIDYPSYRRARVRSAELASRSTTYRAAFERASAQFEAETTYVRALAAADHDRLSRVNSAMADSLRRLAIVRRDAGDASDLDVELATVNASQAANLTATDSLAAVGAVLDLQFLMGMPSDTIQITLSDSLAPSLIAPPAGGQSGSGAHGQPPATTLQVAAASEAAASAEQSYLVARRSAFAQPSISVGVEGGDPSYKHAEPAAGVTIPFPLFNRNGGGAALEAANVDRARAQLAEARRESAAVIAQARRAMAAASARAARDSAVLGSANRVAILSLTAFKEGAEALPAVLDAQRSAREALVQYIDDLATMNVAAAAVRLFTSTVDAR